MGRGGGGGGTEREREREERESLATSRDELNREKRRDETRGWEGKERKAR